MKKFLAILILVGAAALAGHWYMTRQDMSAPSTELRAYGNVEMREALLSFRVPGRISRMAFEEGARVRSGDLAAEMDPAQYEAQEREAAAALSAAEASASKLHAGYEADDIRAARAARDQVAASLRNAETNLRRFQELAAQNVVAPKEYDDVLTARDSLRAALNAADSTLHRLTGGFRSEDKTAAEAQVAAARARHDRAATALADTKLFVPADGTISTRIAEPGTMVAAGSPVYTMMLSSPVQVRAYVSETDLGRIRLGMKGRIYTDSAPQEPIEGTLSFIASDAEFTPKQVQTQDIRATLVYRVRLLVTDDPKERLKNGMPVTVVIDTDTAR